MEHLFSNGAVRGEQEEDGHYQHRDLEQHEGKCSQHNYGGVLMLPWSSRDHPWNSAICGGTQPLPSQGLLKTACVSPVNRRTWSAQEARGLSSGSAIVCIYPVLPNAGLATYLLFSSSVPSGQQSYHSYGDRLCQRPSEGGLSQNPPGLPCCHCIVSPRKWEEPWFQSQTDLGCLGPVTLQLCALGQAA